MRIAIALLLVVLVFGVMAIADEKDTRVLDPVCRMKIGKDDARAQTEYRGKRYYFCAVRCRELFDGDPLKYLHKASKFLKFDPICMMRVDPKKAAGKSVYNKTIYYFCNTRCKELFDKEPVKYEKVLKSRKHQDPVCRRKYPMNEVAAMQVYGGKQYFFCTTGCKDDFARDPRKYTHSE